MCSGVVKFLSLTFICIVIIDGGICREEGTSSQWKRQSNGSESTTATTTSDTTGTGGLSPGGKIGVGIGVPGGLLAFILSVLGGWTCCKRCNNDSKDQSEERKPLNKENGGTEHQKDSQENSWKVLLNNVCNWLNSYRCNQDCKDCCNWLNRCNQDCQECCEDSCNCYCICNQDDNKRKGKRVDPDSGGVPDMATNQGTDTGATNPDTGNGRKTGEPKLEKPTIYGDVQLGGTSTKTYQGPVYSFGAQISVHGQTLPICLIVSVCVGLFSIMIYKTRTATTSAEGLNTGQIVGIVSGIVGPILAFVGTVVAIVVPCYLFKKQNKTNGTNSPPAQSPTQLQPPAQSARVETDTGDEVSVHGQDHRKKQSSGQAMFTGTGYRLGSTSSTTTTSTTKPSTTTPTTQPAASSPAATPPALPGVSTLTEDLDSVATKWYSVGLQLGIQPKDLDAINGDSDWTEVCFRKTLSAWLGGGNPTHDAVITALRSATVGHNTLAEELKTGGFMEKNLNLGYLLEVLNPITSKWHSFGLQLSVDPNKLNQFEAYRPANVRERLREMLECWLQKYTPATIQNILYALETDSLGEKTLANTLEERYRAIKNQPLKLK